VTLFIYTDSQGVTCVDYNTHWIQTSYN